MATSKCSERQRRITQLKNSGRKSRLKWTMLAAYRWPAGRFPWCRSINSMGRQRRRNLRGHGDQRRWVLDITNVLGNPNMNWFGGVVDTTWVAGDTAVFGNLANNASAGAAGTVTIDDDSGSVSASGVTFNAPGSGNYTIAAISGDSLALTGTAALPAAITVAAGVSPTISAPISGSNGLTLAGTGTLNLAGETPTAAARF